jgi:hypothetical protein
MRRVSGMWRGRFPVGDNTRLSGPEFERRSAFENHPGACPGIGRNPGAESQVNSGKTTSLVSSPTCRSSRWMAPGSSATTTSGAWLPSGSLSLEPPQEFLWAHAKFPGVLHELIVVYVTNLHQLAEVKLTNREAALDFVLATLFPANHRRPSARRSSYSEGSGRYREKYQLRDSPAFA